MKPRTIDEMTKEEKDEYFKWLELFQEMSRDDSLTIAERMVDHAEPEGDRTGADLASEQDG